MIHVEVRNRIGKDAFDLFGRDLVLNEIARIWQCRKHVGEIFFASMLPH